MFIDLIILFKSIYNSLYYETFQDWSMTVLRFTRKMNNAHALYKQFSANVRYINWLQYELQAAQPSGRCSL